MTVSLSDLQSLLDSRMADLKHSITQRMDSVDQRLDRVEEHVRAASGDRKVVELLDHRVASLEKAAKEQASVPVVVSFLKWGAMTAGAVYIAHKFPHLIHLLAI